MGHLAIRHKLSASESSRGSEGDTCRLSTAGVAGWSGWQDVGGPGNLWRDRDVRWAGGDPLDFFDPIDSLSDVLLALGYVAFAYSVVAGFVFANRDNWRSFHLALWMPPLILAYLLQEPKKRLLLVLLVAGCCLMVAGLIVGAFTGTLN